MSRATDKHSQAYRVRRERTDLDRQRDEGADIPTDRQTDRQTEKQISNFVIGEASLFDCAR